MPIHIGSTLTPWGGAWDLQYININSSNNTYYYYYGGTALHSAAAHGRQVRPWPLQEIRSIEILCPQINHSLLPPPHALSALLQYYCTTFAQYTPPPLPPLCMPYTTQYWYWQSRVNTNTPFSVTEAPSGIPGAPLRYLSHCAISAAQDAPVLDALPHALCCPLPDIAITNIVLCMIYKGVVGRGAYIAR